MLSIPVIVLAIITGLGIFTGALLLVQHFEFRRFVRSRLRCMNVLQESRERVAVIVPIKGLDVGIEDNLAALFQQDYSNYEIVFVVERQDDLAVPSIQAAIHRYSHIPASIVIAGLASDSGQKVHNLSQAVLSLGSNVEVLAFVDADTRPTRRWLKSLIWLLDKPGIGATSAYPWYVPERPTLPNLILCSIVSSAVALCGRHAYNMITGPSWAIRRDVFHSVGILEDWKGTLSDDLVASRAIWRAGLRVEFQPASMGTSHVDMSWSRFFEFLRRQAIIVRNYSSFHWSVGIFGSTVTQLAFWGNLIAVAMLISTGNSFWFLPALAVLTHYALAFTRARLRQDAKAACLRQQSQTLAAARWFDMLASPFTGLIFWGVLLGSTVGNCITWRANRYRILRSGKIEFLGSNSKPDVAPIASVQPPQVASWRVRISQGDSTTLRESLSRELLGSRYCTDWRQQSSRRSALGSRLREQ